MLNIIVIGGMAAGPKFAMSLRRRMPKARITLIEKGEFLSVGACVLPYYLSGLVPDLSLLTRTTLGEIRNAEFFKTQGNIECLTEREVLHIHRPGKTILVRNLRNEPAEPIHFATWREHVVGLEQEPEEVMIRLWQELEILGLLSHGRVAAEPLAACLSRQQTLPLPTASARVEQALRQFLMDRAGLTIMSYDKLFLATGTLPVAPKIQCFQDNVATGQVQDFQNVHTLRTLDDGKAIGAILRKIRKPHVVILGGGMIGMETASAIKDFNHAATVTVVERQETVLSEMLDRELALLAQNYLVARGIQIQTRTTVVAMRGSGGMVRQLISQTGELIEVQLVVMSIGTRPNTELARNAGLEIGALGGILVDPHMVTSDPDILAGGDCIETRHRISQASTRAPFGDLANIQARVAAQGLAGEHIPFPGVLGTSIAEIFCEKDMFGGAFGSFAVGSTGLGETAARRMGYDVVTVLVPSKDRISSLPDAKMIFLKMLADRHSRKLLGVQAVGLGDINRRIASAAAIMHFGGTIDDLACFDFPYAPPFSPAIDPLIMAAWVLQNKIAGLFDGVSPQDVMVRHNKKEIFELLDVREPIEFQEKSIPGSRLVPLSTLSSALEGEPRDKPFVLVCLVGLRSYLASCIMRDMGFTHVQVMEGGISLWPGKAVCEQPEEISDVYTHMEEFSLSEDWANHEAPDGSIGEDPHEPRFSINTRLAMENRQSVRVKYSLSCELHLADRVYQGISRNISQTGCNMFIGYMPEQACKGDEGILYVKSKSGTKRKFLCRVANVTDSGVGLSISQWEFFFQSLSKSLTIFGTGLYAIDQDHMVLWGLLHREIAVHASMRDKENGVFLLLARAREHFQKEEDIMRKAGYPGIAGHMEDHTVFLDQATALQYLIHEESSRRENDAEDQSLRVPQQRLVRFLISWLVRHTNSMDQSYVCFIKSHKKLPELHVDMPWITARTPGPDDANLLTFHI